MIIGGAWNVVLLFTIIDFVALLLFVHIRLF